MVQSLLLLLALSGSAGSGPAEVSAMLDRAAYLNQTEPWQVSDELLDRISPLLGRASPEQVAQYRLLRARNAALAGNYHHGIELIEQVIAAPSRQDQRLRAYELGANIAVNLGDFESAFDYLGAGLVMEPEVDAPDLAAQLFSLASYFHTLAGELESALFYGRRSMERARSAGLDRSECIGLLRYVQAVERAGDFDNARQLYEYGIDLCARAGDPTLIAASKMGFGENLRQLGRLSEAEEWLSQGTEEMEHAGYLDGRLNAELFLARLWVDQGRSALAEQRLRELTGPLAERSQWERLADAHQLLAELAERQGRVAEALRHYRDYMHAWQNFINRERSVRLAYLEVEFETRRREQDIALLREQNRVLELEEEARARQNLIFIGGASGLAVIGLLLLFLLVRTQADRRRFRRLSERDSLTGLYNHTQFFTVSRRLLEEGRRQGSPFCLVLADVDHFKQINDQHGHILGDEVLRRVAARMREVFPERSAVGRIGGEEFGIALGGVDADEAQRMVERLRARLSQVRADDQDVAVTLSYGLVQADRDSSIQALRRQADQALYRAKRGGRDRLVRAGPPASGQPA